jgi:two-component system NarL family sensor kinase
MAEEQRQRRTTPRDADAAMLRRRNRELATLKAIAEMLNKGVSLHETMASTLPLVVELLDLHTGWLFLLDEQEAFFVAAHHALPPALAYPGEAWCESCTCQRLAHAGDLHAAAQVVECSRLRDATGDRQGLAFHASVPLIEGDHLLGIMNVATSQWDVFTPQDLQILSSVGYQLATAIERTRLAEQATRIALVEERNRLAREVHDTLAQELAGIALQLEAADILLDTAPDRARTRIRQALEQTRESLAEARRSVLDLRSGPLERQNLSLALEELVARVAEEIDLTVVSRVAIDGPRLPARHEQALYRIAQEALSNVRRHAHATTVEVELSREPGLVRLTIADDGCGFAAEPPQAECHHEAPAGVTKGFGLISMRERAHLLGGTMRISSGPGAGTRVEVCIPLDER